MPAGGNAKDRPVERVCPQCQHTKVKTTLRTTRELYVRCRARVGDSANRPSFLDGKLGASSGRTRWTAGAVAESSWSRGTRCLTSPQVRAWWSCATSQCGGVPRVV